jgi:hypothetical protein
MGLPSCFLEKKIVKHGKGDDITPFDGICSLSSLRGFNSQIFIMYFFQFEIENDVFFLPFL